MTALKFHPEIPGEGSLQVLRVPQPGQGLRLGHSLDQAFQPVGILEGLSPRLFGRLELERAGLLTRSEGDHRWIRKDALTRYQSRNPNRGSNSRARRRVQSIVCRLWQRGECQRRRTLRGLLKRSGI